MADSSGAVELEAVPGRVDGLDPGLVEGAHDRSQLRGGAGSEDIVVEAAVHIEVVALAVVHGPPKGERSAERVPLAGPAQLHHGRERVWRGIEHRAGPGAHCWAERPGERGLDDSDRVLAAESGLQGLVGRD